LAQTRFLSNDTVPDIEKGRGWVGLSAVGRSIRCLKVTFLVMSEVWYVGNCAY